MDMDEENTLGVQEQADRWFARLLAPDCSAHERETFERWRRVPEHASAYAQREHLWRRFGAPEAAADPRLLALRERVQARTVATETMVGFDWQQALATLPPSCTAVPSLPAEPPTKWVNTVVMRMNGAMRSGTPPPGS